MKLWKRFIILGVLFLALVPRSFAAVDVTPLDLQNAASLLKPSGSSLGTLPEFSSFYFRSQNSVPGGLSTRYQALLLSDPWLSAGLPEIQILLISYPNQDAASAAFSTYATLASSSVHSTSHSFFYTQSEGGASVDLFDSISTEGRSHHWLEKNGNVIIQSSLYLGEGTIHSDTRKVFEELSLETVSPLLSTIASHSKISLGLLFPPEDALFASTSESASLELSALYALPKNGVLSFDLYVSDPEGASGTVLDSSGILSASDGDFYLYITGEGKLQAGIYAPSYDADCVQSAGWYSVKTSGTLYPYEWNRVVLRFGVGGFGIELNGSNEAYCSVSQARSSRPLFLGDYPSDTLKEGMLGMVDHFTSNYSLTAGGEKVDEILERDLFLDLDFNDPDRPVFQTLKERGVFMGTDGNLKPDQELNRAAMVKIILRTFGLGTSSAEVGFYDVPSDSWYKKYLAKAVELGMIKGRSDGSFGGGDLVTRSEFFAMLRRLDPDFDPQAVDLAYRDVDEDDWFYNGAAYAYAMGFVSGSDFLPEHVVTRREAARVLYELL